MEGQYCYVGDTVGYPLPPYLQDPVQGLCPPGFYCPNSLFNNPATWPRYCPATPECLALRADKKYCGPQGPFEPIPCPAGSYCPSGYYMLPCPAGSWCPLGTQWPHKCHALMHCPEGMVDPPYDYSSIVAAGLLDILILVGVFFIIRRRRMWWGKVDDIFAEQTCAEEIQAAELARKLQAEAVQRFEEENNVSCNGPDEYGSVSRSDRLPGEDGMPVLPPEVMSAITKSHREAIRDSPAYAILELGIRANRVRMMPMHIQFEQLSVVVPFKGSPKQLLKGITGAIVPGHVTAIMGPSGAGKTVFMTSLLNKVESNWKLTGKLTINGLEGSTLSDYQHMMGYVPQDDVMHPELTVMENIWFSAETRLPREWDPEDRLRYVAAVIKATGLEEVRHVVVGNGSEPNGVNRKRVCIAMELAAAPAAVFLDEPTTGLDAATALDLCYLLKDIAVRSQLTVAMVIHQPRVEIWESLDEVLLIAPGGRTVYQGPQAEAQDYFVRNIGLDFSVGNPADIILDGISANQEACEKAWDLFIEAHPDRFGVHTQSTSVNNNRIANEVVGSGAHAVAPGESIVDANNANEVMQQQQQRNHTRAEDNQSVTEFLRNVPIYDQNGTIRQNSASISNDNEESSNYSGGELFPQAPPAAHATFVRQLTLVHYRSILKQSAHLGNILLGVLLSIAAAAIMGTAGVRTVNIGMLISPYSLLNPRHTIYLIPMMMMFYLIAIASSTSASAIRALGEDRQQYWKEASTGRTNKLAYFIAMTTGEIYRLLITTMHFALVAYFMWNPLITFWWFFLILLLAFFANDSQGAMLGLVISPKHAPLLTTVAAVFISLLNGFPNIPGLTYIGYSFYLTEVAINRYVMYQELTQTNEVYEDGYFHYTVHRLGIDLGVVIGIIALYRIAAFMIMTLTNRNKQR